MAFFSDTFTDTDGVLLQSHAPTLGTSWTRIWGTTNTNAEINTNRCRSDGDLNSGVMYSADATYPSADYDVTFTLVSLVNNAARPVFIFVRLQDQENMYAVYLSKATNACSLYKKVAGTWTAIGSFFDEPADGSICKLEIIGTSLKFYDDGVQVASATVSDHASAGKAGIGFGGGAELVATTDDGSTSNIIDTLTVNDLGSSGQTVTVNQASAANTAQAVTRQKSKSIGQNAETDTAQGIGKSKSKETGQSGETDAAQALISQKIRSSGQAAETEAAQAITSRKTLAIALNSETDSAQSIRPVRTYLIGQAAKTDSAQAIIARKKLTLGQAAETDSAQSISVPGGAAVAQGAETDQAQPITPKKTQAIGQASELELVQALFRTKRLSIGQPAETDLAQALGSIKVHQIGQVLEADSAQVVSSQKAQAVGQASEADTAPALQSASPIQLVPVGMAVEVNYALDITVRELNSPALRIRKQPRTTISDWDPVKPIGYRVRRSKGIK